MIKKNPNDRTTIHKNENFAFPPFLMMYRHPHPVCVCVCVCVCAAEFFMQGAIRNVDALIFRVIGA